MLKLYRIENGKSYDTLNAEMVWQGTVAGADTTYRDLCWTKLTKQEFGLFALAPDGKRIDVLRCDGNNGLSLVGQQPLDTSYDMVRAFLVGGQPHFVCYEAKSGMLRCYRLLDDFGIESVCKYQRANGTVTTDFTVIETYSYRGLMLLLAYNTLTGDVVIYQFLVTASAPLMIQQCWSADWAPGWTSFGLFSLGGEAFFIKSNTQHKNMVYIDHLADDPAQGSHPVGAHLPALPPTPRTAFVYSGTPYFAYATEANAISLNRIHVDCQGWTTVGQTATSDPTSHLASYADGDDCWLLIG